MHQELDMQVTQDLFGQSFLEIQEIENMGKGLISLKSISMNQLILKIPQDLILTRNFLSKKFSNLSEIQSLIVCLAYLKFENRQDSREIFFSKYFDNVEAVKLPMFFSKEILQFSSSYLQARIQDQLQNYDSDIQAIKNVLNFTDTSYLTHAWILVNTRCVSLNSNSNVTVGLIPFLDYLNHSCKSQSSPKYNTQDDSFELWNCKEILKGEQVYLSYGNHDNTFLATEYGFVEEDNEFDYVYIEKEMVYSKISIEITEILEILAISRIPQEFVVHFEEPCYPLLMTLRLAVHLESNANDVDFRVWDELVRGERDLISQENEQKVYQIIQQVCFQVKKDIEKRLKGMRSLKYLQKYNEEIDLLEKLAIQEFRIINSVLLP